VPFSLRALARSAGALFYGRGGRGVVKDVNQEEGFMFSRKEKRKREKNGRGSQYLRGGGGRGFSRRLPNLENKRSFFPALTKYSHLVRRFIEGETSLKGDREL